MTPERPLTKPIIDHKVFQIDRIRAGIAAAQEGRVRPAEEVFAAIAAKHGWARAEG